jgi:hypothetical protein
MISFRNRRIQWKTKIPHSRNNSKIPHSRTIHKYHTVGTIHKYHSRNNSKIPHSRNNSKIPHSRNNSKIPHSRNNSKIHFCGNREQNRYQDLSFFELVTVTSMKNGEFKLDWRRRRGPYCMLVGFTTTYAINIYHHWCCRFESRSARGVQHYVIKNVSVLRQVDGFLRISRFLHQ